MSIPQYFKDADQKTKKVMLKTWDMAYYEADEPLVSDEDYDDCLAYYNSLYKEKYVSSLGNPGSQYEKYEHQYPVLSLEKVTTEENYLAAGEKFGYVTMIQPKIDGLTVVMYPDGTMVSRGNGHVGEILPAAAKLPLLPEPLDKPVRMEVFLGKEERMKWFRDEAKNSRNIAAGILRRKEISPDVEHLSYLAYNILGADDMTESEQIAKLHKAGFSTPTFIRTKDKDSYAEAFQKLHDLAEEQSYPTDGVVIKADISKAEKDFGTTGHHPKNAFAYKFPSTAEATVLRNIEWSVSCRKITPVAVFDPVVLGGNTVTRASLHNLNIMNKLGVAKDSRINVALKNEIIPQIVACSDPGPAFEIPEKCPCCGSPTEVNASEELVCTNPDCKAKLLDAMTRAVSREGLDIMGLSEEYMARILDYHISKDKSVATPFTGLCWPLEDYQNVMPSDYMAGKIYAEIKKKLKNVDPVKFLYACNIPGVGTSTAKCIMEHFSSIDDLLARWETVGKDIDGIGKVTFDSVTGYLPKIKEYAGSIESFSSKATEIPGKTICISGSLSHPKSYYEKLIVEAGYRYVTSVTKTLDYLVAADTGSTKAIKAAKYGIPVIDETQFLEMVGVKNETD